MLLRSRHRADVAGEPDVGPVGREIHLLAHVRAVELNRIAAALAVDGVAAVVC